MSEREEDDEREEARIARSAIPSVYVDTWSLMSWKGHLRLVLAESLYGKAAYRTAVVMETEDAERLARHLLRFLELPAKVDGEEAEKSRIVEGSV